MRVPARPRANVFPAAARPATLAATAISAAATLMALALLVRAVADGVTFAAFLSITVALVLVAGAAYAGYLAWALRGLRYEVEGGALVIVWGLSRQVIPLAHMRRVVRGRALGLPAVHGITLPGLPVAIGAGRVPKIGRVLFYSTHRTPEDLLYVLTTASSYGISPADQAGLIAVLQAAAPYADPAAGIRQEVVRHPLAALPLWSDRVALRAAAAGGVLALLVVAVIFARYTGTPDRTTIPFPDGDRIAAKSALLAIPATAIVLMLINTLTAFFLHRPVRPVAYMLLFGGIFVQTLLVAAALISG